MTTKQLTRRRFLRGLGGAAVAAPFLSSVAEREAKSQGVAVEPIRRLIVYFTHYGCLTNRWFPTLSHGPLTTADYEGLQTLKPMAPYADKLLMVRGVRAMNEWSFGGTLGQTTDPHTQVCGSFFSCYPVTPDDGKTNATSTGRTLDHICAEQANPDGSGPLFVQIGGVSGSATFTQSVISYDAPGRVFPGISSPSSLFSTLTGLYGDGPVTPDSYRVARGESVLDVISDDLDTLSSINMSASDKQKLTDWKELLHQTGGTITSQCNEATATALGLTSQSVQAAGTGNDISKSSPVWMDLAVLASLCDFNRVIFLKAPPNYKFSFLGHTIESHSLSHRIGTAFMGGDCVDNVFGQLAEIDDWYAQQFAHLVGRLNSFDEGDVKLLDNTATVWFQEMSDGNSHNLNNLPILQAGGCAGYFKTGQAINVEGGKTDLTVGHSEEECKDGKTNPNLDAVGTPADQASRPINKYFCNLMNAIGVKAGEDGYPAVGGQAAVSRFGKYDDTKLFKGGGPTEAKIDDPGEYSELRGTV